jgi:short-subunit dehydrogenase
MQVTLGRKRFGPWALVTGASSGIGREFARQVAGSGINVVLVARREELLKEVAAEVSQQFGVEHRVILSDLSEDGFIARIDEATRDLDIGLLISNAGTASSGLFLTKNCADLIANLRLNAQAHLELAHYFGKRLSERGSGGIMLIGAMGADNGVPFMANEAATKAYVQSLGLGLHDELKSAGVCVTVLPPGPTETPVLAKLGLDPRTMPMKPMKVDQCVYEGLRALGKNRPIIIPGRMNRIMSAIVPGSLKRAMMAKMFGKMLTGRPASTDAQKDNARAQP